jgi:hypothetical protein
MSAVATATFAGLLGMFGGGTLAAVATATATATGGGTLPMDGSATAEVTVDRLYNITISALPASAVPIENLEWRQDGGPPKPVGGATTGTYQVTALIGANVQIRAVNRGGPGPWSDPKFAA